MEPQKKYNLNLSNGDTHQIDEGVAQYILNLQNQLENPKTFPKFYDLADSIKENDQKLLDFYLFILKNHKISNSQLFQDLFVLFISKEMKNGKFLEFGATNGLNLSNTILLESKFNWQGLLVEPSPQWIDELKKNRPQSKILNKCIYSKSGQNIDFYVSQVGDLSTIEEFRNSDQNSMSGNCQIRNQKGYSVKVSTISLNEVFKKYFNGESIDYMSVDTEGSEFLILSKFNFKKYGPKIVTVEHNFTENENKLDNLFEKNNYTRYFVKNSQFDAWYVRNE